MSIVHTGHIQSVIDRLKSMRDSLDRKAINPVSALEQMRLMLSADIARNERGARKLDR